MYHGVKKSYGIVMSSFKILHVESSVSSGSYQPMVIQTYGDNTVSMSAESARARAIAIFQAIAYADSLAIIFKTLVGSEGVTKPLEPKT